MLPVPNPLSGNTMCFLSLPALAPGFVKCSQGITEGQNPSGAQHLQPPLTSGTRAGAGSISWVRGGKGCGDPEPALGMESGVLQVPVSGMQPGPVRYCFTQGEGKGVLRKLKGRCWSGFIPSTLNNTVVPEKLWSGARCILVMLLNLVEDPACIFPCPHKLTSS